MSVPNHTRKVGYKPDMHKACEPCSGASKGGEYQENSTMGMMTKPPHRYSKVSDAGAAVHGPYGGKKPQSR